MGWSTQIVEENHKKSRLERLKERKVGIIKFSYGMPTGNSVGYQSELVKGLFKDCHFFVKGVRRSSLLFKCWRFVVLSSEKAMETRNWYAESVAMFGVFVRLAAAQVVLD